MKLDKLVGDRFKERPADCITDSHAFMVRGGYIKYVANGIYSSYLPLKKITKKIEQILREEMDKIDGQEVQFPVVMPASLWQESGRYESIGNELLRFKDRNNSDMVLGMTHEEAAVQLVKEYANSYSRYPFMIYQIQTKFRDEPRPRAGLIRVREVTMKDGYLFHTSKEDLDNYYGKCLKAYERIFKRAGRDKGYSGNQFAVFYGQRNRFVRRSLCEGSVLPHNRNERGVPRKTFAVRMVYQYRRQRPFCEHNRAASSQSIFKQSFGQP